MIITLQKFGTVLSSRATGKEAYSAFLPSLAALDDTETITVDFGGIISMGPSWADEFITPLFLKYGSRVIFKDATNPSVALTLETLEQAHGVQFPKR